LKNRFYTILFIPEKSDKVRKAVLPQSFVRGAVFALLLAITLSGILVYDYVNVLNQVKENKQLRVKNRLLLKKVQEFDTKMETLEDAMNRIRTFSTKLRIITNFEESGENQNQLPQEALRENPENQNDGISSFKSSSYNKNLKRNTKGRARQSPTRQAAKSWKQNNLRWIGGDSDRDTSPEEEDSFDRSLVLDLPPDIARLATDDTFDAEFNEDLQSYEEQFIRMEKRYGYMIKKAQNLEVDIQDLYEHLHDKRSRLRSTPMGKPTRRVGWITSRFGWRISPYHGRRKMHEGVDVAAPYGTPVYATADGLITYAGVKGGFGKVIAVDHGYGVQTYFGHNSKILVRRGEKVKRGQIIARVGSTGRSTGPHVHYEVRVNGVAVDPNPYLLQ
jgi:murein DD-endopeptidase MepM/ murein hydrolase activator NlpD